MIDNREALAYVLFARLGCSRDAALAAVDAQGAMVAAVGKALPKRYRMRRRIKAETPGCSR